MSERKVIDHRLLTVCDERLMSNMIAPATEEYQTELAVDHSAEPIKSLDDINRIAEFLLEKRRWRDYMMFICGINFGLRASDLLELRFGNMINDDLSFKTTFPVFERKTRNTRKKKKNRYITINSAVINSIKIYLAHTPNVSLSDYMFRSESNRCTANKPMTVYSLERILKGIAKDCNLSMKISTHTLRKTFCYHQMLISNNDPRKLLLLQKMLGHSSVAQTLEYIGITYEEMEEAYKDLNLGIRKPSSPAISETKIVEFAGYKVS